MAQTPDKFWVKVLWWTLVNFLGVAAVGGIRFIPYVAVIPGKVVTPLLIGLPIGFAQWIALRRSASISFLWVFTISAGLILGLMVSPLFAGLWSSLDDESILSLTLGTTIFGLLAGMVQWIFLQVRFNRAWIWPLASAAGIGSGIALILVTNLINVSGMASIILATGMYFLSTGIAAAWLLGSQMKLDRNLSTTI